MQTSKLNHLCSQAIKEKHLNAWAHVLSRNPQTASPTANKCKLPIPNIQLPLNLLVPNLEAEGAHKKYTKKVKLLVPDVESTFAYGSYGHRCVFLKGSRLCESITMTYSSIPSHQPNGRGNDPRAQVHQPPTATEMILAIHIAFAPKKEIKPEAATQGSSSVTRCHSRLCVGRAASFFLVGAASARGGQRFCVELLEEAEVRGFC